MGTGPRPGLAFETTRRTSRACVTICFWDVPRNPGYVHMYKILVGTQSCAVIWSSAGPAARTLGKASSRQAHRESHSERQRSQHACRARCHGKSPHQLVCFTIESYPHASSSTLTSHHEEAFSDRSRKVLPSPRPLQMYRSSIEVVSDVKTDAEQPIDKDNGSVSWDASMTMTTPKANAHHGRPHTDD